MIGKQYETLKKKNIVTVITFLFLRMFSNHIYYKGYNRKSYKTSVLQWGIISESAVHSILWRFLSFNGDPWNYLRFIKIVLFFKSLLTWNFLICSWYFFNITCLFKKFTDTSQGKMHFVNTVIFLIYQLVQLWSLKQTRYHFSLKGVTGKVR